MLNITDLKPGIFFELNGTPHQVVFAEHFKMGRGGAILRTKVRNLFTGAIFDQTFKGNEQFEGADVVRHKGQFLYTDSTQAIFMDNEDFEQYGLPFARLENERGYLKESLETDLIIYKGRLLAIQLPAKVDLKVTYTEPGIRGDTQGSALKPATLETGLKIQVPLFINQDDMIRVDTRDGRYEERVS